MFFDNLQSFGFYTQSLGAWDWQSCCDFALKCYNLFLLFFYFNIIKFIVRTAQTVVRRFKRWTNS